MVAISRDPLLLNWRKVTRSTRGSASTTGEASSTGNRFRTTFVPTG